MRCGTGLHVVQIVSMQDHMQDKLHSPKMHAPCMGQAILSENMSQTNSPKSREHKQAVVTVCALCLYFVILPHAACGCSIWVTCRPHVHPLHPACSQHQRTSEGGSGQAQGGGEGGRGRGRGSTEATLPTGMCMLHDAHRCCMMHTLLSLKPA